MGLRNHVLGGSIYMGAIWRIQLNNPCLLAIQAVAIFTVQLEL